MTKMEWGKEARSQAIGIAIGFLIPSISTFLTVVFGVSEKFGTPVILVFASIVLFFTTATVFLVQASRWFVDVEHKLRYVSTHVGVDLERDNRAAQAKVSKPQTNRKLSKIQIGVQLFNAANYPVSAFTESVRTSIEGHCPKETAVKRPVIIGPGNQLVMADHAIDLTDTACGPLKGRIEMTIKYGQKGKEKYTLEFKADLQIFIQPDGRLSQVFTNWDASA
jgi:hypothetical protein